MRKKSGQKIIEKYSPYGEKKNSFYEEQESENRVHQSIEDQNEDQALIYYLDNVSGELKAKNTTLLR